MRGVILCVDDEDIILSALEMQLSDLFGDRFDYEFALDADEAMEILDSYDYQAQGVIVIVSDWLMPGVKGDAFLVKAHGKFPRVVKIMLTGQADPDAVENARRHANLHRCLSKPWQPEDLRDAILEGLDDGC